MFFVPFVAMTVFVFFVAAFAMLAELAISRRHETRLLARGAVAPPDPAYASMRWAYPLCFVAMTVEGLVMAERGVSWLVPGAAIFVAAKALKAWAIASLGERWTYRVLVLPEAPLVASGPYAFLRHPNYVGVAGELIGFALMTGARLSGVVALLGFGYLLRIRIAAEERALGRS